jgi:hypothetical protein
MNTDFTIPGKPSVAVGAIGGSGTPVVAIILASYGIFKCSLLNKELDNLFFTYFFKYRKVRTLNSAEICRLLDLFVKTSVGPAVILPHGSTDTGRLPGQFARADGKIGIKEKYVQF